MRIYILKLKAIFMCLGLLISLTGCEGEAGWRLGAKHEVETINGVGTTTSELYGQLYVNFRFGLDGYSPLGAFTEGKFNLVDPSTWEIELDNGLGIISEIKNHQANVKAFSHEQQYSQKTFPLTVTNNRARFADPSKVASWLMQQESVADQFRVELITVTENRSGVDRTVAVKMKQGGITQAVYSFTAHSADMNCNPVGPPSEVDIIC